MAVNLDDRPVDQGVFEVRILREFLEKTLEHPLLRPAPEALPYRVPFAEMGGKIPPGRADAHHPQDGFDKQPVVCSGTAGITGFTGKQWRDALPLLITQ